jgi:exonuclease VII small subunit
MAGKKTKKEDRIKKGNISESLLKLQEIVTWFEEREDIDLEEGIRKVKEGAEHIKIAKSELKEIDNEFKELEDLLK